MSTHYADIRRTIDSYIADQWPSVGLEPLPVLRWPNDHTDVADDGSWIRPEVLPAAAVRGLITGSADTGIYITGLLVVQVFTTADGNEGRAWKIVDAVCDLFREQSVNAAINRPIVFFVPEPIKVGVEDNRWLQINVQIPFEYMTR